MDIDKFLPQCLTDRWESMKNYQEDCLENLRSCQAVRTYRQAREFSHFHPVIAMFLAIVFGLGLLPVIVFLSFVFGSFVVIFFTALTAFEGVLLISLVSLLTMAIPILMFGGVVAAFVYTGYCCVVKVRRITKRFEGMLQFWLPSRIHGKRIRFAGHRVKTHACPPSEEETFMDEMSNSSSGCF